MRRCFIFIFLFGITSQLDAAVRRSDLNTTISINYGMVEDVEKVKLKSDAGRNAIVGGMIGASFHKHHKTKHAAEGALAAALVTALIQHKSKARRYLVNLNNGSTIKLISEVHHIHEGDCVAIEQGHAANIRRVSSTYCEYPDHDAFDHPAIHAKAHSDAAACHEAKDQALLADTEESVDIALKKVRVFCEY